MPKRTSDLAVNSHMHPRHGVLGISVLWLTSAFLQLVGDEKLATGNITCVSPPWLTATTGSRCREGKGQAIAL